MVFWKEKNRVPRRNGATTSKGFFPPIYASSLLWLLLFSFFISLSIKYSVTGQCGGRKIPSVGRAFYDSHGVFRSLYPFLTTPVHRYNPCTLNPCIIVRNYMVEDKCYLKKKKKKTIIQRTLQNQIPKHEYIILYYYASFPYVHGIIFLNAVMCEAATSRGPTISLLQFICRETPRSTDNSFFIRPNPTCVGVEHYPSRGNQHEDHVRSVVCSNRNMNFKYPNSEPSNDHYFNRIHRNLYKLSYFYTAH